MKTIKEIAGNVLVFLYEQQRGSAFNLADYSSLRFDDTTLISDGISSVEIKQTTDFENKLLTAGNDNAIDLYNALDYLYEKDFLSLNQSRDSGGVSINALHVTSEGIDIIEGVERGTDEQKKFYVTFNIKLADNINVESLIKNQVDSLFKASVL